MKEPIYLYLFFDSSKTMRWKKYLVKHEVFVTDGHFWQASNQIQLESHEWIASHIQLMFGQQPSGF